MARACCPSTPVEGAAARTADAVQLLQEGLGGRSSAAILATLRVENQNLDECISTLRFAQRARAMTVVGPWRWLLTRFRSLKVS